VLDFEQHRQPAELGAVCHQRASCGTRRAGVGRYPLSQRGVTAHRKRFLPVLPEGSPCPAERSRAPAGRHRIVRARPVLDLR
jgi:hypothetical protein